VSNFSILHGEAVSLGMAMEGALAHHLEFLPLEDLERQNALLKRLGLPVKAQVVLKALLGRPVRPKEIVDYTHRDKKARQGMVEYVLPTKIGSMRGTKKNVGIPLDDKTILNFIRREFH
jgi:3-dehydroquinate synthase